MLTKTAPELALVKLTTTLAEYVLVAEAQIPPVAAAVSEQTGAAEQEIGAV